MSEFAYDVVIGLGANLGDPSSTFRAAAIGLRERLEGLTFSRLYRTAPIGPAQPDFLNAAVRGSWRGPPLALLHECLTLEQRFGRVRTQRWGPRRLDLDVLWIAGAQMVGPELTLPHPRLPERAFALRPLLDVAPEAREPGTERPYASYLAELSAQRIEVLEPTPEWWSTLACLDVGGRTSTP